jgi:hypothetical protein
MLSFVVPAYNADVVADGASTDRTPEITGSLDVVFLAALLFVASALCFPGLWGLEEVSSWLARAAGWERNTDCIVAGFRALSGAELALAAGLAVLLGPLIEELLFRGFSSPWRASASVQRAG